jgi:two-component system sensor histidine kinase YesM
VAIISIISIKFIANIVENKTKEEIKQTALSISTQLDRQNEMMESISRQIIFSTTLKALFYQYINSTNFIDRTYLQTEINKDLLAILTSANPSISQLSLQSLHGDVISVGGRSQAYVSSPQELGSNQFLAKAKMQNGAITISTPQFTFNMNNSIPTTTISMVRFFTDPNSHDINFSAFVEVQQSYKKIQDIAIGSIIDASQNVLIVNSDGNIIFPFPDNIKQLTIYRGISNTVAGFYSTRQINETFIAKNSVTNDINAFSFSHSNFTGWTVFIYEPQDSYLAPIRSITNTLSILTVCIAILTLYTTYRMSKSITAPISALRNEVCSIDLQTLKQNRNLHFEHHEYKDLQTAFSDMFTHLHESFELTLQHRQQEIKTRLYVLQSKMDPHFLNNALALIQLKARQGDLEGIRQACAHLSGMTHYLYKDSEEFVELQKEIEYAEHYLSMMKSSYLNDLVYSFSISDQILHVRVPKLILQPLVENSLKHGIIVPPPWIIHIRGMMENNHFILEVEDNGIGFPENIKQKLLKGSWEEYDRNELEGIGLSNIITRLRLLYGDKAVIEIITSKTGGAIVRVGGSLEINEKYEIELSP